jgi:hypothetical protein
VNLFQPLTFDSLLDFGYSVTRSTMRQQFLLSLLFALLGTVSAQFNFFEQMFGGNQGGGGGGGHHQQQQQNAPSDSAWYRAQVDRGIFTGQISSTTQEKRKL